MTDPVQLLIDAGAIPSTPFDRSSRYLGISLGVWQRPSDATSIVYVRRRFIPTFDRTAMIAHVTRDGERPDLLAAHHLGDALLYWRIADANAVLDPHELTELAGTRVLIPQGAGF